jgi:serine protease Do
MFTKFFKHPISLFLSLSLYTTLLLVSSQQSMGFNVLTEDDINGLAKLTTVVVGEFITNREQEASMDQVFNPGSGVIISHQDNDYYVLTNTHVVNIVNGSQDGFGVITSDNKLHRIENIDNLSVIRYGNMDDESSLIRGYDLALLKFTSTDNYAVASIGNSQTLKINQPLYISGWPKPTMEQNVIQLVHRSGYLSKMADSPDFNMGGYSILYTNQTRPGMSGSPIFNQQGELVGIHGYGITHSGQTPCIDSVLNQTNSCGIQSYHFLNETNKRNIRLSFNFEPPESSLIEIGKKTQAVITNPYKRFSSPDARLRLIPSGGCGSLLLGDKCPD